MDKDLEIYQKYFGRPGLQGLEDILKSDKLSDDEKIICIRGWLKLFKTARSTCETCGILYETYPIIMDNNPLSIASYLEDVTKDDGTFRHICEPCRDKEIEERRGDFS